MTRAKEFRDIGVDAVFVEALPDRESMAKAVQEIGIPTFANIIEGGLTENLSAKDLAELGMSAVAYPWRLVAAKLKAVRDALETLKESMTQGAPPPILSYAEVCEGVGFNKYWDLEERYKYNESGLLKLEAATNGTWHANGTT
jgi:2-methylisocitrate lyase-like PEP mutase family enzyme